MCDGYLIIYVGSLKILKFDVKNSKLCTLVINGVDDKASYLSQ